MEYLVHYGFFFRDINGNSGAMHPSICAEMVQTNESGTRQEQKTAHATDMHQKHKIRK